QVDPIVIDNPSAPCSSMKINVQGKVQTSTGIPLYQVNLQVVGQANKHTTTSQSGLYYLNGLEAGQNMHIEATDLSNPQEGVSTQDLVFITKHILGKQVFDSPFKYLAADVDQNGLVNVTDILHIRRLILGITEEFPQAPSWQFYRMNYTWDANPLGGDKPVYQDIFDPQGDLYNVDFVGVKTGDVNMNAANGSQEVINRDSKVLELKMENVWTQPGLDGKLAIRVNHCSNLTGFQGTLTFDPSMIEITNLEIASKALSLGNFGLNRLADGKLSFSYDRQNEALLDNEVICYLEYKGLKSVNTAELFVLGNIPTPVESYFQSGSVSGLQLAFDEVSINHNKVEAQWALFQNSPNPWTGETVIDIDAPQRTIAWLSVFDMQGKEVFRQMRPLFEGQNHWNLQASDLNGAGVYFYRLETTEFSASKKMILTK
ncbi:MAG: T9SS type A sorting domain-containing protein, partial [Saprospiraceae bacterium]